MNLDFHFVTVAICLVFLLLSLLFEWFKTPISFLIVVSVICLTGVMTPQDALHQIANEQIAVVLMLMIVGNILRRSILVENLFKRVFKDGLNESQFLSRQYWFVGVLSAFFNNTPLVAILMPQISDWSRRNHVSPSRLLIPLSFASIIGGGITLIGTSTNLIVDKLYRDSGGEGFALFDFALFGIPLFLIGYIYTLIARKVLRTRVRLTQNFKSRDYLVETKVKDNAPIIGMTVEQAGLRNLKNLFLVEIIREGEGIRPVKPVELVKEGDKMILAGDTSKILPFLDKHPSFELNNTSNEIRNRQEVLETVVPYNSSLIGKKINETGFRAKYDAAIIGVRRNGERLYGKIGDLEVQKGDMFLCLTGSEFEKKVDRANELYVISNVHSVKNIDVRTSLMVLGAMLIAMVLAGLKVTDLFSSMLIMLTVIAISGKVQFAELRKSFNYNFLLIGGGALVFGKAMVITGVAENLATKVLNVVSDFGDVPTLIGVFVVTNLLASLMTNIGAVVIVFPIASLIAQKMGVDLFTMSMMVAFGGSKILLTAIGYQTNLMVQGPGGYKAIDYLKYGGGLLILIVLTFTAILSAF
ncbi:SLC13 family permease [Flavobacteriales bacterium]|nr:SLC13 family permease [Flavobacteriales bacterium]